MGSRQLVDLRQELTSRGLYGFLVPRADEHLGEYVPANAERLAWLTGFTGSAGLAIVLQDRACLFVDGRYVLQAAAQIDADDWEQRHLTESPPSQWLSSIAPRGVPIGYDPLLISEEALARFTEAGCNMVAVESNPIDVIWCDRPGPPLHPVEIHPLDLAGRSSAAKREEIATALRNAGHDAAVLSDPASIAWLLNIRGSDVPFTPVPLGFAIVHADRSVQLFMPQVKLPGPVLSWLGQDVTACERGLLREALAALAGRTVRVDAANCPAWFGQTLRASGAKVVTDMDPCLLPKACKNAVEQEGIRAVQARDAVAVCRFLFWLRGAAGRETELSASERLLALRREQEDFRGESFAAISASGEHGAIMHYRVTTESNRSIQADEVYLIDSGGQYGAATTDVTRTIWTGPGRPDPELRDRYTRVLRGHIAIATLVFPKGVSGVHLDAFSRHALWEEHLDFDHGTGHGVGSYLSVHEGPVSLSRLARPIPLGAGMLLSNEPGFYASGRFGIRLENLVLVQSAEATGGRAFLRFETVTHAPFDRALIDAAMLSPRERAWLDAYHAKVLALVGPALDGEERRWLSETCSPLAA